MERRLGGRRRGDVEALGLAHDVKNLLFVIGARCERLRGALTPAHPLRTEADAIACAARQAAALTRELLAPGIHGGTLLDLNPVICQLLPLLETLGDGRVRVTTTLEPSLPPVRATFSQIERVLTNLAMNACSAMVHGGVLTVATERRAAGTRGGAHVAVIVSDTGPGIDAAVLARLDREPAEPPASRATGLGLPLVRALVAQLDGVLDIESAPGCGTRISVVLPAKGATAAAAAPLAGTAGLRILLVENDTDVMEVLRELVRPLAGTLVTAASGADALASANDPGGGVDVLLSDVNLGDMSGIDLAHALRRRHPYLHVVLMSGEPLHLWPPLVAGAAVLEKPFSLTELQVALRRAPQV